MKKIGFLLLAGLLTTACGNQQKETVATVDDEEVEDSGINEEVKNFKSPDLALNALHSKVDYAVTVTYGAEMKNGELQKGTIEQVDSLYFDECGRMIRKVVNISEGWNSTTIETFEYDADGQLKSAKSASKYGTDTYKYKLKMSRNADGYIASIQYLSDIKDETMDSTDKYVWDNGLLKSFTNIGFEWGTTTEYEYDDNDLLLKEHCETDDEGMINITTVKYDYKDFDEYDNWTNCSTKVISDAYEDAEVRSKTSSEISYKIKERQITYRK